jgi:hypothetical protein
VCGSDARWTTASDWSATFRTLHTSPGGQTAPSVPEVSLANARRPAKQATVRGQRWPVGHGAALATPARMPTARARHGADQHPARPRRVPARAAQRRADHPLAGRREHQLADGGYDNDVKPADPKTYIRRGRARRSCRSASVSGRAPLAPASPRRSRGLPRRGVDRRVSIPMGQLRAWCC